MGTPPRLQRATLGFLADLEQHNERPWFEANRTRYLTAHEDMVVFTEALLEQMRGHDRLSNTSARGSLMRIHADQRFHKGRPPYAARFGGRFVRVKPALRGGYFLRIQPGDRSHVTCGFMGPVPADLRLIRKDIDHDHATWRKMLKRVAARGGFGPLIGEQVPSMPRGYGKGHPAADLLRRKQFLLRRPFSDAQVLAPDFLAEALASFRAVRPWFDHMTAVLTSDGDGA